MNIISQQERRVSASVCESDIDHLIAQQISYWQRTLTGLPERLKLPTDRSSPAAASHKIARFFWHIDLNLHGRLLNLAHQNQVSLFMVLNATLASLLTRMGAGTDIPVGTLITPQKNKISGDKYRGIANTLVLRTDTSGNPSFLKLLQQVKTVCLSAYAHQDIQFERLVEALNPARSTAHHPLFQVLFALQDGAQSPVDWAGLSLKTENITPTATLLDLSFYFNEMPNASGLNGVIEYATDLFNHDTIAQLAQRFLRLLEAIVQNPEQSIGCIEILDETEREQLLSKWNDTTCPILETSLPALFEAQVEQKPNSIALVCGDQQCSYAELNIRANRLAHRLIREGIVTETPVAVLMQRSIDRVLAALAIIKAGGIYTPLNGQDPESRLHNILRETHASVVLTDCILQARCRTLQNVRVIPVDNEPSLINESSHNPAVACAPEQLAYLMYTSGSTGQPKGVGIKHRLVSYLAFNRCLANVHDHMLVHSSHAFDVSIYELWTPLLRGGQAIIAPPGELDILTLQNAIKRHQVNVLWLTSGLLQLMAEGDLSYLQSVRQLVAGGDILSPASVQRILKHCPKIKFLNGYGPTETHIATCYLMQAVSQLPPSIPIGTPMDNAQVYVLDAWLNPVSINIPGELYIGGEGVARGYFNRPGLTSERFVANPFSGSGTRLYRTGDLVRWRSDDTLDFIGRADQQIKIRGFRIEPGEVEAILQHHPALAQATVIARQDPFGNKQLIGYVVAKPEKNALDCATLRQYVADRLPDYMVPAAIVQLASLPLTPNGKVNCRELPDPDFTSQQYQAPHSLREQKLAELFADILGLPQVGTEDSFFDLGGHSLLAMRLVSRIRKVLEVEFTIRMLFETPTVAGLAKRFAQSETVRPPLRPQHRPELLPLSFAQRRLWFIHQLDGASATYNLYFALRLSGALDALALQAALQDLLKRHETLRTRFVETNGSPAQHICSVEEIGNLLETVEVTEATLVHTLHQAVAYPFNLRDEIPLRTTLFKLNEQEHVLLVLLHHITGDGWSFGPFARDISQAYAARLRGQAPDWAPLPVQYADYTLWQRDLFSDEDDPNSFIAQQLKYWRQALAGLPERLTLPTDRPHPPVASHKGAQFSWQIQPVLYTKLSRLARENQASLFMVLQAALASLLTRMGAGTDIPIGVPIAGRTDEALNNLVGFFLNTLVLRTNTSGNPSFHTLLQQARETCLTAYAHQDLQFERLVEILNPARSTAHHPLFQVSLALQNNAVPQFDFPGLQIKTEDVELPIAKFDLSFHFSEDGQNLSGAIQYATDLFDRETIAQFAQRFTRLLEAVVENPEQPIGCIELLDATQKQQLLIKWNDTAHAIRPITLPELFATHVARTPDAIALSLGDQSIPYAELDIQANRLAHYLITKGIGPEDIVAVTLSRSPNMVIALLAVLKTGAAYLPLDPHHSTERHRVTLNDARPAALISTSKNSQALIDKSLVLQLDDPKLQIILKTCPETTPTDQERTRPLDPGHPAYVIYTSGSTGTPKGVVITHRSLINYIEALAPWINKTNHLVWISSVAADLGNTSLYGAIFSGKTLIIVDDDETLDAAFFTKNILKDEFTLKITPSHLASLMKALPEKGDELDKIFFLGGERVDTNITTSIKLHWKNSRIINHYGPTESTIGVLIGELERAFPLKALPFLPLGRPILNTQVYILDDSLKPLPIGVGGELYIAGAGLARGYLNRPGLTAECFVANPFGPPGSRMYRSGDLVKWRPDGFLDFLGRTDDQIKIRGFRLELGEIEAALRRSPALAQVAVIAREDHAGHKQLIAYVVANGADVSIEPTALRRQIAQQLPDYMVPAAIVVLKALPLTSNGKLDRKALPAPHFSSESYRAPRTAQEQTLATLFAKVLNLPSVGIDDSFFDLGGHSLSAVRLTLLIQEVFKIQAPVRMLFEADTVAKLAERIESNTLLATLSEDLEATEQLMRADAILAEDITLQTKPAGLQKTGGNILLTGATGFVGRYLLIELLKQTHANVICLVNAATQQEAKKRILAVLEDFRGANIDSERISVICGDLSKENLGLTEYDLTFLADQVDAILHNGAIVNHFFSYHELRQANVIATETLIRLAAIGRNKSLHYISTISVAPRAATGTFTEKSDISAMPMANGYAQSKWVAEHLINAAARRGIVCSIYRLGRITADSTTGHGSMNDTTYRIIRAISVLGLAFDSPKRFLQTPVDCAARAIIKLAVHQNKHCQIAHIIGQQVLTLHEFMTYLNQRGGISIKPISFEKWLEELKKVATETLNENLMALLSIMDNYLSDERADDTLESDRMPVVMSAKDTLNRLYELNFEYPYLDHHYLASVVNFLLDKEATQTKNNAVVHDE